MPDSGVHLCVHEAPKFSVLIYSPTTRKEACTVTEVDQIPTDTENIVRASTELGNFRGRRDRSLDRRSNEVSYSSIYNKYKLQKDLQ